MAKEDFCFTYYDGDAARDTTHMNRLDRGAYHDLILAQRKFGHLTFDQIKKVLGRDFNECWPAIELIMKTDSDGKYYVEWLDNSIKRMRKHSTKQSENVSKRYQNSTKSIPNPTKGVPLGDGNGNGNGNGTNGNGNEDSKEDRGVGEETIDFTQPDVPGDTITFPLDTRPMRQLWAAWKKYRWDVHGLRYRLYGEQADLSRLQGMTYQQIEETIKQAIAGNWKNLYPEHGKSTTSTGTGKSKQERNAASLVAGFAARYGEDAPG